MLFKHFFGGGISLLSFEGFSTTYKEWVLLIPLSLIGVVFGIVFISFDKVTKKISSLLGKNILIKCIIAGLILGILGTILGIIIAIILWYNRIIARIIDNSQGIYLDKRLPKNLNIINIIGKINSN